MTRVGLMAALAVCLGVRAAEAFCGFYVAATDAPMFNDATEVVLMRNGTRTVLAMQNHYHGPPDAFAMVIPVPTVLQERDVKILAPEVFERIERMGSPRLVEYWEQDPCAPDAAAQLVSAESNRDADRGTVDARKAEADLGVTVESQFAVGEYQIAILSATDSAGLETWLRREQYQIPAGAEPVLRSYVEAGMKFFVAKVDPLKIRFDGTRAVLSPLRFHYDSERFSLPIRLGLANSAGTQDLIVNILAPGQRYEVANYPNVTIPTNLTVKADVRERFGAFYVALLDATLARHPGAVVTEYAWDAATCDPCPGPTLDTVHLQALGADVIGGDRGFVLTRLHARYGKDIAQDLQFREAKPIAGGREHITASGRLEAGAVGAARNRFQARYVIRHPWTGPLTCESPVRGRWGAKPGSTRAAVDLAFAPRGAVSLAAAVTHDIPELGLEVLEEARTMLPANAPATDPGAKSGCGCSTGDASGGVSLAALLMLLRRRRR